MPLAALAAFAIGYLLSQLYRSFLAVLAPVLSRDLSMSETELALASGAWFVTFALAQFPIGYLLDTVGPKRTVSFISGLFAGGGALLFAAATSGTAVIVGMGLIGIGCAPLLMGPMFVFARRYPAAVFATYSSSFIAFGTLGNIIASEPIAILEGQFGWRLVMAGLALSTVVVAVATFLLVRDPERLANDGNDPGERGGFLVLLKLPALWLIFPSILFSYAVSGGVRGLWVGPYFENVFGMDALEVGRSTLFMAIALAVGSLAYGPMDRIFNTRKWVVFFGNAVVVATCAYLAFSVPPSVVIANICFVLIGFFGASYAVQMAHGRAFVPEHLTGRGVTLLNFCSIGGVGLMQVVSGYTAAAFADPARPEAGYQAIFLLYAITLGVALLIYLASADRKPGDA